MPGNSPTPPWYREWEAAFLVLLVVVAYFVRVGDLEVRGEESRRAQVGFEMLQTGDWIVPREQGDLFLSRPPLQNWVIALTTEMVGSRAAWAIRLHTVAATLLTTLLIYGYARIFLNRLGALTAGLAFATFGEMFTLGALAETEALFIFFVAGSLLMWHWGWQRGWPETLVWTLGYGLAALGALTKGPQAPFYFVATTWLYVLISGQWRRLATWPHLLGIASGVCIVALWQVPYVLAVGWEHNRTLWSGDTTMRFYETAWTTLVGHFIVYPLESAGCTLPWSLFLLFLLLPAVRHGLRKSTPSIHFVALSLLIAFPTCWLPPGSVSRYFAPMYPCLAVLIGAVVQQAASLADPAPWRRTGLVLGVAMASLGAAILGVAIARPMALARWNMPLAWMVAYALAILGCAGVVLHYRRRMNSVSCRNSVLALAGFMVTVSTGYFTDVRINYSQEVSGPVADLVAKLPAGERLVSLRHVGHLFAYHYGKPIVALPWPGQDGDVDPRIRYFCFNSAGASRPDLPFAWEELGCVSIDRRRHDPPHLVVVVGRRLDGGQARAELRSQK